MQKVNAVICGVNINDMVVMSSKYDGYDSNTKKKFKVGDQIAFKHKSTLTQEQISKIFPSGKIYNLAIVWPSNCDQIVPNIDDYVLPIPSPEKKITPKSNFIPSQYQNDILNSLLNNKENILIEALAGSGKTSTLVWLVEEISKLGLTKKMRIIYLAFNKSIQKELAEKLEGTNVPAQTTHAFGFSLLKSRFGSQIAIKNSKTNDIFSKIICEENGWSFSYESFKAAKQTQEYKLKNPVLELVSYAKNWAVTPTDLNYCYQMLDEFVQIYEVEFDNFNFSKEKLFDYVVKVLVGSIPSPGETLSEVTYDDMLYLPIALNLKFPTYDLVLTDESQDFNFCQIRMLEKLANNHQ